jgi:Protein of unknown function (DUF3072)
MRNAAARYGGAQENFEEHFEEHLAARMTYAQALRLRTLSEEAYQSNLFEENLTRAEADRRIEILKAEIELADSF